jgi:4-hydroxybenzoate polyprenyltransferase
MIKKSFAVVRLMRPHQWTKNVIVFVGVVFGGRAADFGDLGKAVSAFLLFCLLSGCVYILNDIVDVESDRKHPRKAKRPLATGEISVGTAFVVFLIGSAAALFLSYWFLGLYFGLTASFYYLLNLSYTFFLKNYVIVDCVSIAAGFVLRAVAGIYAFVPGGVEISLWLLICTFFLALFLAFAKRRAEVTDETVSSGHRKTLIKYSPKFLDEMIAVVTASTVMSYSIYTIWPETIAKLGTRRMAFTIPFVVYGVFRYLYLIHRKGGGASPTVLLVRDKPMLLDAVLYGLTVILLLYVLK